MSTTVVLIDKNASLKELVVKQADFPNLYKKAGFTSVENFIEHYQWDVATDKAKYSISLWGKKKGKNAKNMYAFPPPLEEANDFCGNVVLVNHKGQQNLTVAEWTIIYDILCEQVLQSAPFDDDAEDDLEEDYVDVAVDDYAEDDEEEHAEDDEEEIYVTPLLPKKKNSKNSHSADDFVMMNDISEEVLLDCSAELQEEDYL